MATTSARAKTAQGKTNPRVDAYIQAAPDFAKPILGHLRALIHAGCPHVEETIKWSRPTFVYRGKMLCSVAVFKAHCSLGFWQSSVAAMIDQDGHGRAGQSSGQFGRITRLADLPGDAVLRGYLAEAVKALEGGKPSRPRVARPPRAPIPVPADFAALLEQHADAGAYFERLSPSHRREYLEWIVEAKRVETRTKRLATSIEWLSAGKTKEWKYQSR